MNELRHALRTLAATPIVTIAAVLSLALGIGANTAIFSLINSLVFRTLPVPNPEQLAILTEEGSDSSWSGPVWEQLRAHEDVVDGAFAWFLPRLNLSRAGEAQIVDAIFASGQFFDVLRVRATLGRTFTDEDDQPDGGPNGPVAVVGYEFWRRHFGGSADAVGQQLVLERVSYTVIGVAPAGFFGPDVGRSFDVVVPLSTWALRGSANFLHERNSRIVRVMVRVKPGQDLETTATALNAIRPNIRQATLPPNANEQQLARYLARPFALKPAATGDSRLRGGYQQPLFTLLAIAGLVLLIACANIANLLLARAVARRREISVMRVLGASRWQVARQFLAESVVLGVAGTVLGVLFAQWTSRLVVRQLSTVSSAVFLDLTLDWRVLGFTSAIGVATAIVFGMVPALCASRAAPVEFIKDRGRGSGSRRLTSTSSGLVVAQVALSLALVVAAGLFLRTFAALATLPLGFETDRLLAVSINASPTRLTPEQLPAIYARVRERAAAVPGVGDVALSRLLPLGSAESSATVHIVGESSAAARATANTHEVSPGFFETLRIPLILGREIEPADRIGTARIAVVNQAFVRRYLGESNPIGRRIVQPARQPGVIEPVATEIVGVVGDTVYRVLRNPAPPTIYFALDQRMEQPASIFLHVRSNIESPAALRRELGAAISSVSSELLFQFAPMNDHISAALTRERLLAIVTTFFGALGLLLAAIGLFGVTSYAVTQRRAEISVRLAIGAMPEQIVRLVLRRVAFLVSTGIAAGAVLTWWLAQFVNATHLYGVQPRDLPTIAAATVVLVAVAGAAAWWPARRAAHFDPAPLLRDA